MSVAILKSDKNILQPQTQQRDKEGHYNDKGVNTSRRYNNCKYTGSKQQSTKYIKY